MNAEADSRERLPALDGLRGVMALCVAFYHFTMWAPAWLRAGTSGNTLLAAFGLYSVQGFFIVSGVCFFHLYRGSSLVGNALLPFHVKRFFRIAPLYYVSLAISLALHITVGPAISAPLLLENVTLSFGFTHPNHALVVGGWSIGVEYVFYAAFPFALYLARSRAGVCALLALLLWLAFRADADVLAAAPKQRFHAYVAVGNHAFLFALGAILAELRRRVAWRAGAWLLPLASLAAAVGVLFAVTPVADHFELVSGRARLFGVLLVTLLVAVAACTRTSSPAFTRLYRTLGELSYGVYLLHRVGYVCADALMPRATPAGLRCLLALVVVALMALAAYRLIELPALRYGQELARRLATRLQRPAPSAAPDALVSAPVRVGAELPRCNRA